MSASKPKATGGKKSPQRRKNSQEVQYEPTTNLRQIDVSSSSNLQEDYAALSQLMTELNVQVDLLATNVHRVIETAPAFDSLSVLWEEYVFAETNHHASHDHTHNEDDAVKIRSKGNTPSLRLDDDSEIPDDPILFLSYR